MHFSGSFQCKFHLKMQQFYFQIATLDALERKQTSWHCPHFTGEFFFKFCDSGARKRWSCLFARVAKKRWNSTHQPILVKSTSIALFIEVIRPWRHMAPVNVMWAYYGVLAEIYHHARNTQQTNEPSDGFHLLLATLELLTSLLEPEQNHISHLLACRHINWHQRNLAFSLESR